MENRIRRLTVEIERRRVEWCTTQGKPSPKASPPGVLPEALKEQPAEPCPDCGAEWLLLHEAAPPGQEPISLGVKAMLTSLNLHLQNTPSGQLWICRTSFDQLKEKL